MPDAIRVLQTDFVQSAADPGKTPEAALPEICFLGRSNVGKSSALNCLFGRRKLARVSNTPGRTRLLNFFHVVLEISGADGRSLRRELSVCDLPGYGYAKAPKGEVARWQGMIEGYLSRRPTLRGAIVLVDARREPSQLDRAMLQWLSAQHRPFRVAVTKVDKIGRNQLGAALRTVEQALLLPARSVIALSSETGQGRAELWEAVLALVDAPE